MIIRARPRPVNQERALIGDSETRTRKGPGEGPWARWRALRPVSERTAFRCADLFGGSGSTLIGCERRGRTARLMELDPRYADVICRRWEEYTGEAAVLEGDGRNAASSSWPRRACA